jgi:hypothetical protein
MAAAADTVGGRWPRALLVAVVVGAAGVGASNASAATTCDPADDACVVAPDSFQTPAGLATVSTGPGGLLTVHLEPTRSNTWVIGLPSVLLRGSPVMGCPGGCGRTTFDTADGLVVIDTYVPPADSANRVALPSLAIISLLPPGPPCRVSTHGTTVTFTPLIPPGPPA